MFDLKSIIAQIPVAAEESMSRYAGGEYGRFVVEGAHAIEMAAKGVLGAIHPSLFVEPRSFDSLLQVCGAKGSKLPPNRLRTIGCQEAVHRVAQIHPEIRAYLDPLRLFADCRNGFLHLGQFDEAAARSLAVSYIQALRFMGSRLGFDDDHLFSGYAPLALSLVEEATETIHVDVIARLSRSRNEFEKHYGHLSGGVRSVMIRAVEGIYHPQRYTQQLWPCPACGCDALMDGDYEVGDWQVGSYDREGNPDHAYLEVFFKGYELTCALCGLHLKGREELRAADIDPDTQLDDVDPADFVDQEDYRDDYRDDVWQGD